MRWVRFFLLLFLVPSLTYALNEQKCIKIYEKGLSEWGKHTQLLEQFKTLEDNAREARMSLLNDAIVCCQRSIEHFDKILHNIAHKSKSKQSERWRRTMKEWCEKGKSTSLTEITHLQNAINHIFSEIAFEKAQVLYRESEQKALLANATSKDCPARHLYNADVVVDVLHEVARLYREAAVCVQQALAHISSFSQEANKVFLQKSMEGYLEDADKYEKEAANWPIAIAAQKNALKQRLAILQEDKKLFEEKSLKRSTYEVQKQILPILEQLKNEDEALEKQLEEIKTSIELFETEADSNRLTEKVSTLSLEEFRAREKNRRELFFTESLNPVSSEIFVESDLYPHVIALDGQISRERTCFTLDTEKFYRFLVQSDTPASHLFVKVYEKGEVIHTEKIPLPLKNTLAWERYLTTDGMVFIPETTLKAKFGIDLYITIVPDPTSHFSLVVAQKGVYSGYRFSVSLDDSYILYKCHLTEPPPWQLGMLSKPALPSLDRPLGKSSSRALPISKEEEFKATCFPILDQFVEELKQDPFLLAGYVYNEIALIDPFLYQENGVFCAPSIHRNACRTFLEKQGSMWEQCQLLVYLLQKAGYQACYAIGGCALPRAFLEKMLLTQLPKEREEGLVQYPWVIFFDGKEWISLFPWMKEMQVQEGYELYGLLPEEYASADRWILRYLKSDEKIVKHIGPDGDDTAGVLFVRFVEEELRKKGLSLTDVGIHRTQLKKQYTSWQDFPRPISKEDPRIIENIEKEKNLFAYSIIEVYSRKNPRKKIIVTVPFTFLDCNALSIRFSLEEENTQRLHIELEDLQESMLLDVDDHYIDIKVNYVAPIGSRSFQHQSTLSMVTGTTAALCFHFGGASTKITSQFYEQFTEEKEEDKRLHALLSFIGAAYFEKCGSVEQKLAHLHKIGSMNHLAFGLSKLSSDLASEKKLPQVDMLFVATPRLSSPTAQDMHSAIRQCRALSIVDSSSNEHWILREVFQDPYAISTIKLLQIAHLEHQKKGLEDTGFLVFSRSSLIAAENTPEAAQSMYFSHLRDFFAI